MTVPRYFRRLATTLLATCLGLTPSLSEGSESAWHRWSLQHPTWHMQWNPITHTPHRSFGTGIRLNAGQQILPSEIEDLTRNFVLSLPGLQDAASHLQLMRVAHRANLWYVTFQQTQNGYLVLGGRIDVRVSDRGDVFLFGVDWYSNLPSMNVPQKTSAQALQVALPTPTTTALRLEHQIVVIPRKTISGFDYRLAHELKFHAQAPLGNWYCLVDAQTNELLLRENRLRLLNAIGSIRAQVETSTVGDVEQSLALRQTRLNIGNGLVDFGFTDDTGEFSVATNSVDSLNIWLRLAGRFARIFNSDQANLTPRINAKLLPENHRTFTWDQSNSRASERDAYYHTLLTHRFIKQLDPSFTGTDYPMPIVVDRSGEDCLAFYDGLGINFSKAGDRCVNTARIADIVIHEYGHAITEQQYLPLAPSGAMAEAFSDYTAATITNQPEIGRGFFGPGTRLRTVDNQRTSPDSLVGQVHTDGLILAGALWETRGLLGSAITDSLFHFARYGRAADVDDYFLDILFTDDDNGNVYDGTPHFDALTTVFAFRGIGDYSVQITHAPLLDSEDLTKTLRVSAQFLSLFPLQANSVTLNYRINRGPWQTLGMQPISLQVREFAATIPPQLAGSQVDYYLTANDVQAHFARLPANAPLEFLSFTIGADSTPPIIEFSLLENRPLDTPSWRVAARVRDNLDRGLASVSMQWSRNSQALDQHLDLTPVSADLYSAGLAPPQVLLGDVIHYRLVARDSANVPNEAHFPADSSASFRVVQGFHRDFESTPGLLQASGDWEWGEPTTGPPSAASGQRVWATSLSGNYSGETTSSLILPPADLTTWTAASLSFQHWIAAENLFDGGRVEISVDGGFQWQVLHPNHGYPQAQIGSFGGPGYSGSFTDWNTAEFDLSQFTGQSIQTRLRFSSDASNHDMGWYIDDLEIVERQILSVPLKLVSGSGENGRVRSSWQPPAGIDPLAANSPLLSYNLYRGLTADMQDAMRLNATPLLTTEFLDSGLINGQTYYYAATALYDGGESSRSQIRSALPFVATYSSSAESLTVRALGAPVDTSVTFSNAGTGFLRLNLWLGDPADTLDDLRIAFDASPPDSSASFELLFADPLDPGKTPDLASIAAKSDSSLIFFRITGHQNWGNILGDFTLTLQLDTDANRATGDPQGYDFNVIMGQRAMQQLGVAAFVSNALNEIVGVPGHLVFPIDANFLEVGIQRNLIDDPNRLFLSVTAVNDTSTIIVDAAPSQGFIKSWLTPDQWALEVAHGTPQALNLTFSNQLPAGEYAGNIFMESNDPLSPVVSIPVLYSFLETPVEVFDLIATQEQRDVVLQWRTLREVDVNGFRVMRSKNGSTFEILVPNIPTHTNRRYRFVDRSPQPGIYVYRLAEITSNNALVLHGSVTLSVVPTTPRRSFLAPNFPNPFNPETTLRYGVSKRANVQLDIFDVRGRWVRRLLEEHRQESGFYTVTWDGKDSNGQTVASGKYHARLKVGTRYFNRSMTVVK